MAVALMSTACRDLLGVPFRLDGRNPATGLSCYGLVLELYRRAGLCAPSLWVPPTEGEALAPSVVRLMERLPDHWAPIAGPEPLALAVLPSPWHPRGGHCGVWLYDAVLAHATIHAGVVFEPGARVQSKVLAWYRLRRAA